jgi:hypothetical protein
MMTTRFRTCVRRLEGGRPRTTRRLAVPADDQSSVESDHGPWHRPTRQTPAKPARRRQAIHEPGRPVPRREARACSPSIPQLSYKSAIQADAGGRWRRVPCRLRCPYGQRHARRVRHATQEDLDRVEALLVELRKLPPLRERKRGYFSRDPGRSFTSTRMPVTSTPMSGSTACSSA